VRKQAERSYGKGFYYYDSNDNTWKKLNVFDASVIAQSDIPHSSIRKLNSDTFKLTIG